MFSSRSSAARRNILHGDGVESWMEHVIASVRCLGLVGLSVCFVGLSACNAGPTAPSVDLGETFVLAPGEQAHPAGTLLTIRFAAVISDSRCPADVVCVTAGDAVVRVEIRAGADSLTVHDLHTADANGVALNDLTLALVRLTPHPVSSRQIEQNQYRAALQVTRRVTPGSRPAVRQGTRRTSTGLRSRAGHR